MREVTNAFAHFDKRASGLLGIEEMKHVLTKIGDVLSPEEAQNFMSMLDVYGDGQGRIEDLLSLLEP